MLLTKELRPEFDTLLAAGTPQVDEGELGDPEVEITHVPLVRPISPRRDLRAFFAVRRLIGRNEPDIIHTHMAKAGAIGRLAAREPSIRTVHTFHGHVLEGYFSPNVEQAFARVERYLAARTDALIAVSNEVRDALLDLGIGPPERHHVIPLGFELDRFLKIQGRNGILRRNLGLDAETPLVAVLGRVTKIKDHATLLRAVAGLPGVHLVVLGDGDARPNVEQLARDLKIMERVHFSGWRTDVHIVLADVDVVALTSLNEGTPVSLIEGSAAARPVVATDVGGVRSVVRDGETGFLASPGDHVAVSTLLWRLIENKNLGRSLGEKGREHVRDRYSHKRLLADITALYDDLLTKSA